jgi:hypothetical protein
MATALWFGSVDDYVELPIGSLIGTLTNSIFAIWVNLPNIDGSWQRIFDFGMDDMQVLPCAVTDVSPSASYW